MACPECDECRSKGYRFCRYCGEKLTSDCPYCRHYLDSGVSFCGSCGRALKPQYDDTRVLDKVTIVSGLLIALLMVIEVASVITGLGRSYDCISDGGVLTLYMVMPFLIEIAKVSGMELTIYWTVVMLSFLACVVLVFWESRDMFSHKVIDDTGSARNTPLFWIGLLFGSTTIIQLAIMTFVASAGADVVLPDLPEGDSGAAIITFVNAGVWEEVVSRILLIGLPMMILALYKRYDKPMRYLLGGFGVSKASVALIIISSLFFALGHMDGWGAFKVPMVVVGGLVMGWLYVRFGIHAAVFFHCLTDLMTVAMATVPFSTILYLGILMLGLIGVFTLAKTLYDNRGALMELPTIREDQESIFRKRL